MLLLIQAKLPTPTRIISEPLLLQFCALDNKPAATALLAFLVAQHSLVRLLGGEANIVRLYAARAPQVEIAGERRHWPSHVSPGDPVIVALLRSKDLPSTHAAWSEQSTAVQPHTTHRSLPASVGGCPLLVFDVNYVHDLCHMGIHIPKGEPLRFTPPPAFTRLPVNHSVAMQTAMEILVKRHTNIAAISIRPRNLRRRGVAGTACIAVYVTLKRFVPIGEPLLPQSIDVLGHRIEVDVVDGCYVPFYGFSSRLGGLGSSIAAAPRGFAPKAIGDCSLENDVTTTTTSSSMSTTTTSSNVPEPAATCIAMESASEQLLSPDACSATVITNTSSMSTATTSSDVPEPDTYSIDDPTIRRLLNIEPTPPECFLFLEDGTELPWESGTAGAYALAVTSDSQRLAIAITNEHVCFPRMTANEQVFDSVSMIQPVPTDLRDEWSALVSSLSIRREKLEDALSPRMLHLYAKQVARQRGLDVAQLRRTNIDQAVAAVRETLDDIERLKQLIDSHDYADIGTGIPISPAPPSSAVFL